MNKHLLKQKLIAIIIAGFAAIAPLSAQTSGTCGTSLTWQLTGSGSDLTLTITGSGEMTDYWGVNPPWYSERADIKTLVLPSGITKIGSDAFYRCSGITSVTIPNNITSIGNDAFRECTNLQTLNFNAANCTTMGSSSYPSFSACTALTTLNIGSEVKNIPDYAFYGRPLTSVMIPNGVLSIGTEAFYGCSQLQSVIIPA